MTYNTLVIQSSYCTIYTFCRRHWMRLKKGWKFCQCQLLISVDGSCCVNHVASILSSSSTSMYATIYQFNHLLQISTMAVLLMITDYGSIGIHNVSD